MSSSGKPAATMSSRLLTMKFMQRAVATPTSSANNSPDQRSAKRQRLSNGSFRQSPSTSNTDAEAVQQALAAEEQKRQEAVDREAAKRGESKWVLDLQTPTKASTPAMTIVSAGYAALDADAIHTYDEDGDDVSTPASGRRSFGVPAAVSSSNKDDDDSDESSQGEDDNDDDDHTSSRAPSNHRSSLGNSIREKQLAKRNKDNQQSSQQAGQRRSKQVNLNKLTSISNAGSGSPRDMSAVKCFKCGKTGHTKARCPR